MTSTFKKYPTIRLLLPVLTLVLSLLAVFSSLLPIDIQQRVVFWGLPLALCLWLGLSLAIVVLTALCALPIVLGASDD